MVHAAPIRLWRITLGYLAFALAWLVASDYAAASYAQSSRELAEWSIAKGVAFVLATSGVIYALLRQASSDIRRSRAALEEGEARYRMLVQSSPDAIVVIQSGKVVFVNRSTERLFRGSAEELVGRPALDFAEAEDREASRERMTRIERGEPFEPVAVRHLRRLDGSSFRGEVEAGPFEFQGGPAVQLVIRDVTAATEAENERRRVAWTVRLVAACHEALVRATSEDALLADICRIAVDLGGLRMAWVGYAEEDEAKTIRPVCWRGAESGYLALSHPTWAESASGSGPTAMAIRSGQAVAVEDLRNDASPAPDVEEMRRRGYVSVAALPLVAQGRRLGVISLYAAEPAVFQEKVLGVLQGLADDLASGIRALRAHRAREEAEAALRERNEQLRTLAARLVTVREEEQTRIARDLHDELGQLLTGLRLDLQWMEAHAGDAPEERRMVDLVVAASGLVDQALAAVRRIAIDLRPQALDRLGLGAALREEGRRFQEWSGLRCDVDVPGDAAELPPEVATALYRIAQEALTNVIRHASATGVSIRLALSENGVALRVEDDGKGPPLPRDRRGGSDSWEWKSAPRSSAARCASRRDRKGDRW
jgi:PAS domain S-box-containing protein